MKDDASPIPVWQLYGERTPFPDLLHIERIVDRAAGLDWTIAPHRHLHLHQLFLLRRGRISLSVDGQTLHPEPPVVLNLPPGSIHGFSFSAGTDGYVLTLPVSDHPQLFGAGSRIGAAAARFAQWQPTRESEALFEALLHSAADRGPFRDVELRAQVALIFCRGLAMVAGTRGRPAADPRFAAFDKLVHGRLQAHLTLDQIAAQLNLSARHLNRLCRAATGLSARAYIEAQVIHEACRLLAYTRMSVQQISWHLGFADASYFSRTFHRCTGRSPTEYRRSLDE